MRELFYTKRFEQDLSKILKNNPDIEKKLDKTISLMLQNINHPSLRFHKLSGNNKNYSISVNMSVRIILITNNNGIFLLRIGAHEEVY